MNVVMNKSCHNAGKYSKTSSMFPGPTRGTGQGSAPENQTKPLWHRYGTERIIFNFLCISFYEVVGSWTWGVEMVRIRKSQSMERVAV